MTRWSALIALPLLIAGCAGGGEDTASSSSTSTTAQSVTSTSSTSATTSESPSTTPDQDSSNTNEVPETNQGNSTGEQAVALRDEWRASNQDIAASTDQPANCYDDQAAEEDGYWYSNCFITGGGVMLFIIPKDESDIEAVRDGIIMDPEAETQFTACAWDGKVIAFPFDGGEGSLEVYNRVEKTFPDCQFPVG